MKLYIDPKGVNETNYQRIVSKFKDVEIIKEVEKSYDVEAMVVFPNYVTKENLDKYPHLKWIQLFTAGFNTIDLEMVKNRDISLTNAKGVYSKTIAEDVLTKILAINRNVKYYYDNMRTGTWKSKQTEFELTASTVGIIGVGSIAKEIAKRIRAFETKVIGYRRHNTPEEYFDEIYVGDEGLANLLKQSDYIILALPLNEDSLNLIDESKFKLMKKDAVLINIARGEVLDQEALIQALENKQIRGAGLDVTVPEPLPVDNKLWGFDNVLITPHNSVSSPLLARRLTNFIIENIENYLNKDIINHVKD
jgi:phosphoglycerate dehydrogenase-like enzyme